VTVSRGGGGGGGGGTGRGSGGRYGGAGSTGRPPALGFGFRVRTLYHAKAMIATIITAPAIVPPTMPPMGRLSGGAVTPAATVGEVPCYH
jgi:hypothetical protein